MLIGLHWVVWHLTTDPLALNGSALYPLREAICSAPLGPVAGYIPAIMLDQYDQGRRHGAFGILCQDCAKIASSRSHGSYREDGRLIRRDRVRDV